MFWPDVGFSWNPAKVSARLRNVLLLIAFIDVGLSRICSAVRDCFTSWFTVLMRGASAVTRTSWVIVGSSRKSAIAVVFRVTSMVRTMGPKPVRVAVTV